MSFDLRSFRRLCGVVFRVEVHDINYSRRNRMLDQEGNMRARNPSRSADAQAFYDHLRWRKKRGLFISFFTNWNTTLHRQQRMIEGRATEVIIVAGCLKGLHGVYDAFSMAHVLRHFGCHQLNPSPHEVLVYGGISADSYRILAMFHGIKPRKEVALSVDGLTMMDEIPGDFVTGALNRTHNRSDPTDKLRDEV